LSRVAVNSWTFEAELWSSESIAVWAFVTLPPEPGDRVEIELTLVTDK
jgi:hypothetical protein